MNLHKKGWTEGLKLTDFEKHKEGNEESVKACLVISYAIGSENDRSDQIFIVVFAGNAQLGTAVQQIDCRGIYLDTRTAEDQACREAGSQATLKRRGRKGHGSTSCAEFGYGCSLRSKQNFDAEIAHPLGSKTDEFRVAALLIALSEVATTTSTNQDFRADVDYVAI